jgi:hypothetical protein
MNRLLKLISFVLVLTGTINITAACPDSCRTLQEVENEAASKAFTKSINKLFQVSNRGELLLDNRHGDITYAVWDRNEVKINVLIEVDASGEDRAKQTFDRINIDFGASPSLVSAKTEITNANSGGWWGSSDCSFTINYTVTAPRAWNINFTNGYGDVRVPDLQGDARLDVRYGNLYGGAIAGNTELSVAYGKGHLRSVQNLDAIFKYAKVEIGTARVANINSKYSEASIRRLDLLELDSQYDKFVMGSVKEFINSGRYDDFRIDSAWSVKLDSRYTDLKLNYLGTRAALEMRYGDAVIGSTSASIKDIDIDGEYTDVTIRLHSSLQYALEAKGRYTDIDLPRKMTVVRKEQSGSTTNYSGHSGANPKARLVLAASYGSIDVD